MTLEDLQIGQSSGVYIKFLRKYWREMSVQIKVMEVEISIWLGNSGQIPNTEVSSVQFSCSVMSDSATHELQHARPPCLSPTPGVHPNPFPLSQWCHPTGSSSVVPFSTCPQSFPASGSFQISQLFASGGQSIGASASISVLPMNIHDRYNLGWNGCISLQSKDLQESFATP